MRRSLDRVESLYNNARMDVVVWSRKDFKGRSLVVRSRRGVGDMPRSFGHRIESNRFERRHR
jgi:hypothetical protein